MFTPPPLQAYMAPVSLFRIEAEKYDPNQIQSIDRNWSLKVGQG